MSAVEAYFLYWGLFSLKPVDVVSTRLVERSGLQNTSEQQVSHEQNMQKICMIADIRFAAVEGIVCIKCSRYTFSIMLRRLMQSRTGATREFSVGSGFYVLIRASRRLAPVLKSIAGTSSASAAES